MSRWTGFDDAQIVDAISELSQHRFIQFDRSKMAGRIEDDRIILKLLVPDEDAFAQGSRNGQRGK